ncbi:TetR/AcrR family transcriptional regulator [Saccharomonospora xinjiangensis]|uniref:TetR/AcrR family transcriptional regulator n=1 Tax=Saccharomonospora xinjiangensis TaxID=75294 RepID=UPI0010C38FFB|nr:TetR/AcrR family transcriptional regulator [Saccharomonospora xinjiangensis]QBQ59133.1 HTH-type transcriptional repressor NicS [Saccharomonospora xinjiangensis]
MPTPTSEPRGRVAKREAITRAARAVFGREGFTAARIETIAAEAQVSTRTIYNHFAGKEELFTAVVQHSSTQVADVLAELMRRHLEPVNDPDGAEKALLALADEWNTPRAEFTDHFALVRRMQAEAAQLPETPLRAWHDAGPQRTRQELARHLTRLNELGVLTVSDPELAAEHFLVLTVGMYSECGHDGVTTVSAESRHRVLAAGVRAFLHGYLPRPVENA